MTPIQLILILFFLVLGLMLLRRVRVSLVNRLFLVVIIGSVIIFTLFPSLSTLIANTLGVGRGVDLLFYFFIIFVLYALTLIYLKLRELNSKITKVVRALALRDAVPPKNGTP